MFEKIKEKILNSSNTFLFYKNKVNELLLINSKMEEDLQDLKNENDELKALIKNSINNTDELTYLLNMMNNHNKKQNDILRNIMSTQDEANIFLSTLFNNNKEQTENIQKILSIQKNQTKFQNDIKTFNKTVLSTQDELNIFLSSFINNNKNINRILSTQKKQNKVINKIEHNKKILSSINETCLRIEKSTVHTNIKIDSKFNENERFLKKLYNK